MRRSASGLTTPDRGAKRPRLQPASDTPSKPPKYGPYFHIEGLPSHRRSSSPFRNVAQLDTTPEKEDGYNGVLASSLASSPPYVPRSVYYSGATSELGQEQRQQNEAEPVTGASISRGLSTKSRLYSGPSYSRIRRIKTPDVEEDTGAEKDGNPGEGQKTRIYRVLPTQTFPKRTTGGKLTEREKERNLKSNMQDWIGAAKKDGCRFVVKDTVPDIDLMNRVDEAKRRFEQEVMVRDHNGIWTGRGT